MAPAATARKRSNVTPKKPAQKSTAAAAAPSSSASKKPGRPNASILNFFQKAEKEPEALFVAETRAPKGISSYFKTKSELANDAASHQKAEPDLVEEPRFNESGVSLKKRRLSTEDKEASLGDNEAMDDLFGEGTQDHSVSTQEKQQQQHQPVKMKPAAKRKGPFVDDSDSDSEEEDAKKTLAPLRATSTGRSTTSHTPRSNLTDDLPKEGLPQDAPTNDIKRETSCPPPVTPLKTEESVDAAFANMEAFADLEDFPDDDEFGGEEYRMMRFMEEQARLEKEAGITGDEPLDGVAGGIVEDAKVTNCPMCDGSLAGASADEATRHVNACLDGNPIPLPKVKKEVEAPKTEDKAEITPKKEASPATVPPSPQTVDGPELSKRFQRAAVPRAGQANPFETTLAGSGNSNTKNDGKSNTAFAQLMSGHAESAAWANAAAAEHASRGKAAYERTCPFYKIMPNYSICVDAFRYGAVKGCSAYFLSHFHSDHYIGLTANWTHGPIYCSKVTGELVKMQLKVAAKYVVALEFDETVEVPGTEGATVTMIPANHCPGSSLFLFEKTFGKAPNTKKHRILHCGDFRACPAHVTHPLLQPDVRDAVTGKLKQQKIDICYLDTTYLNPRYSFPPQDDVIKSCAQLCASFSPNPNSDNDYWDRMTSKTKGPSVSKYFTSAKKEESSPPPAAETSQPPAKTTSGSTEFFDNVRDRKPPRCRERLLVICGTYSIGKERICKAIAKALNTKIFASPAKIRICSKLGDPELTALMTSDPLEAQVHMQMLMEIRAETLRDYLDSYKPHFSRIVGFRPSGWNYRPSATGNGPGKGAGGMGAGLGGYSGPTITANANTPPGSVPTTAVLHSSMWRTRFGVEDLIPQRGSMREAMCFGVPYSEHSSFRELSMFVMSLRIERVVPTVNVGSEPSRKRMKGWADRWMAERRRGGIVRALVEGVDEEDSALWEGKDGKGGGAWW